MRVNTTEKLLPGSQAERRVCEHLGARGWRIEFHNARIVGVQVDILARSPDGILTVIEVKSQTEMQTAHIPNRQMRRLRRAANFLAEFEPIEMVLALVHENTIQILPVDGLTDF